MKQITLELLKAISIIFILPIFCIIWLLYGFISLGSDLFDGVVEDFKNMNKP